MRDQSNSLGIGRPNKWGLNQWEKGTELAELWKERRHLDLTRLLIT